jgi:ecotin
MITRRFRHTLTAMLMIGTMLHTVSARGSGDANLEAFPEPEEGMQRFVIALEHKERGEEDAFKVEIIAGKMMPTDGVNVYRLGSIIEPRNLKGWGYTYYEVTGSDLAVSTRMAPPENTPMVDRFVAGTPLLIRYNSRLPLVIYAPDGYGIRYRIWQASEAFVEAGTR